jgi:predicted dehydrogenase
MEISSKTVGLAFIGMGYWGPNLLRNFLEVEGCQVIGVSDLKPGRLAFVRKRYPYMKTTEDYKEFLDDPSVDAVCLATSVTSHYALAKAALLAGKHVLVTKPMADSEARATEIFELAAKQQKQVLVDHTFVFSGGVNKVRELIRGGELGRLCYIEMTRMNLGPPACEVDVVWDLMSHDISILLHWLGELPHQVSARGWRCVRKDLSDVAFACLEFSDGIFSNLHASWLCPQKTRQAGIFGYNKMVRYDDLEPVAKVKVYAEGFDNRIGAQDRSVVEFKFGRGEIRIPALDEQEPLRKECAHFIDGITHGKPLLSDARMGLEVVKVLGAISASIERSGEAVRINADRMVTHPA